MEGESPLLARRPVAVIMSRFPSLTETFILREITEMERQGQPVRLVPLLRQSPPVVHPEALPWVRRALYTPFLSVPILRANLRTASQRPVLYLGLLLRLILSTLRRPRFLVGTLGIFPKSVYLATCLQEEDIRHLHAHFGSHPATAAFIISALSGATFSVTLHAHDLFMPRHTPFLGPKLRAASFIRVISEFNRRYVLNRYPGVVPEKVHVVHVGVPAGDYLPSETAETPPTGSPAGAEDAPPTESAAGAEGTPPAGSAHYAPAIPPGDGTGAHIVSVAGLRPYKGLSVLVDACRHLRDEGLAFHCTIVGAGPLQRSLQRQIAGAGLEGRIRLAGALTQSQVADLLRLRPIFAHPSVALRNGMMDGIPVAVMEAMAAGAPVVASRLSGIPELIEAGVNGILVEPRDSTALARAIRSLAEDPGLARSIGEEGARKVRAGFSLDGCTGRLVELVDGHNPYMMDPLPPSSAWRNRIMEISGDRTHSEPPGRGVRIMPSGRRPSSSRERPSFGVRILHDGGDSRVVEVLPPDPRGPHPLVVKVHKDRPGQSRPPADRARHEYEVMAWLTSVWGNGAGHGEPLVPAPSPRLLDLDAEAGLLVMEASSGRRLDQLLRAARTGRRPARDEAMAAYERTGQWLRRFQNLAAPSVDARAALEAWRAEASENLARCAPIIPERVRCRAEEALACVDALPSGSGMAATGLHGDLWPGNVMVGTHGVEVLDFEGYRPGVAFEDPAYFLLHSELFFDFPLIRRRFRPLRAAFLRGYGREDLLALKSYRTCRISVCLRLMATACENPNAPRGSGLRRQMHQLRSALKEAVA